MDTIQVQQAVAQALRDPANFPWLFWIVVVIVLGVVAYLGAYLGESAKQQAILERLREQTKIVEEVKQQNATLLQQNQQQHDLRLAALSERLRAYQEAYALWWELRNAVFNESIIGSAVGKCQHWWLNHNLYLDAETREAFYRSYMVAGGHKALSETQPRTPELIAQVLENWRVIEKPGPLIEKIIRLPPLQLQDPEGKPPDSPQP